MTHKILFSFFAALMLVSPQVSASQAQAEFTDLPKDHFAYDAVQFLRSNDIISGYDDGTFRPDALVNRAETLKIVVSPLIQDEQFEKAKNAKSSFTDVAEDAWFKPYVELARVSNIIDGPPKKTAFNGADPIIKAEFLKIVQTAFSENPQESYSEIVLPLSSDVGDTATWFYPYFRFAIASSMTMVSKEGTLNPSKQITRAEASVLLYRYIMYKDSRRNQALLSEAESEILIVLQLLDEDNITEAEYASARALLAARGAHTSKPTEGIVKGAVKITEAFRSLVLAYRAGNAKFYDETIQLAGEAWNLAARGKEFSSELSAIAGQVQEISKSIADNARAAKEE